LACGSWPPFLDLLGATLHSLSCSGLPPCLESLKLFSPEWSAPFRKTFEPNPNVDDYSSIAPPLVRPARPLRAALTQLVQGLTLAQLLPLLLPIRWLKESIPLQIMLLPVQGHPLPFPILPRPLAMPLALPPSGSIPAEPAPANAVPALHRPGPEPLGRPP